MSRFALENSIVNYGDLVLVTSALPFGVSGTTNMMMVETIGDMLVRGRPAGGSTVEGNITILLAPKEQRSHAPAKSSF